MLFRPSGQERTVADILSQRYGKQVDLLPQIAFPQGIQVPDYLIDGDRFDLKSPTGQGKNLVSSMVSKKKKQAPNFNITDGVFLLVVGKSLLKTIAACFCSFLKKF